MRILIVGAGGVGDAVAKILARRSFWEVTVVTDYDPSRAERTIAWIRTKHGDEVADRFVADAIDASNADSVAEVPVVTARPT
jgi:saccharopine dehydrogenase-like NADP-dependent oxidoreductase